MRFIHAFCRIVAASSLLLAVPAYAASLEATYANWESLRSPDAGPIRFEDGYGFLRAHPSWPEEKTIRLRTETAAMNDRPAREVMAKFCADYPPISGRGKIACVVAGVGDQPTQKIMLREAWIDGDFNENEEERILKSYGDALTGNDHRARMERLLYDGKLASATRMLAHLPASSHRLLKVRLALLGGEKNAPALVKTLSAAEQRDAGVLFERLRFRTRKGDTDLADLLLAAPQDVPYPARWWPIRLSAARDAIGKRQYALAYSLIAKHGELEEEALADALWLKGWLLLRHRNDAANAYKAFYSLYSAVTTPVSKARAAYWAARAADKNGNADIARDWLVKAARHPTVFYGQLAHAWLKPNAPLPLPAAPTASESERDAFSADERVAMIRLLAKRGDEKMRDLFLTSLGLRLTSEGQFALLAELAKKVGGTYAGVEAAKLALRQAVVILPAGWPRLTLPENLAIEPALTLAITRQESEFNATARSSANAQGLMQLLPSTGKQVARKLEIPFGPETLSDPSRNLTLGSHYLGQLINGFDGAYILGIASYNAGPGNVRGWIQSLGTPPKSLHGRIDWIESIPFAETRNYVMRALENLSVYRALADADTPLAIERDVQRGL